MRQAGRYEAINAVLGLVLVALTFAPWETHGPLVEWDQVVGSSRRVLLQFQPGYDVSGWDSHTAAAALGALFGLACLAQWVWLRTSESPAVGLAWAVMLEWAGIVVAIWLLVVVLGGADQWGAIAALATTIGILIVGWLGFADERVDRAQAPQVPEQPVPTA